MSESQKEIDVLSSYAQEEHAMTFDPKEQPQMADAAPHQSSTAKKEQRGSRFMPKRRRGPNAIKSRRVSKKTDDVTISGVGQEIQFVTRVDDVEN